VERRRVGAVLSLLGRVLVSQVNGRIPIHMVRLARSTQYLQVSLPTRRRPGANWSRRLSQLTDEPLNRGDRRLDTQEVAHSRTLLEFPSLLKAAGDTGIAQPRARPGPPKLRVKGAHGGAGGTGLQDRHLA
jgi:hypothetical protein